MAVVARLPLRAVAIAFVAALAELAAPKMGVHLLFGLTGVVTAFAGMLLFMWPYARSAGVLFPVVFAASFIDFDLVLRMRVVIRGVPLNAVDIAFALAAPSLIILLRREFRNRADRGSFRMTALITLAVLGFIPAFLHGTFVNGWYDAYRDFRILIFIALAYLLTRKRSADPRALQAVIGTMLIGGVYGMIACILLRGSAVGAAESYDQLRTFGIVTPSIDFTSVSAISFAVCGQSFFRRKWPLWVVIALWLIGTIFQLTLTAYLLAIVIPALCWILAPLGPRRKAWVAAFFSLCGLTVALALATILKTRVGHFISAVATDPRHIGGRRIAWIEAYKLLHTPLEVFAGLGMGTRKFVAPELGGFVIGEPTYSTYLIGAGLVGVLLLVALQSNFVITMWRATKRAGLGYTRAIRLTFLVYGVLTMVNCILHNNFLSPQISTLYGVVLALGSSSVAISENLEIQKQLAVGAQARKG